MYRQCTWTGFCTELDRAELEELGFQSTIVVPCFLGIAQVGKMVSGGAASKAADQMEYEQTTGMLRELGLEKYEKNFKKGMLTDRTLPLLSDRSVPLWKRGSTLCSVAGHCSGHSSFWHAIPVHSFICPWLLCVALAVPCKR